jgi:hypothetical protein
MSEKGETLEINTANLAAMLPNVDLRTEPHVYELEGPPQSYFEIPLDWFANDNAEIEPGHSPGAVRLVQRVVYYNFGMIGDSVEDVQSRAQTIVDAVHAELNGTCEIGYLWWRKRPEFTVEQVRKLLGGKKPRHKVRLRLGTSPSLPTAFWVKLSESVKNVSAELPGKLG